VWRSSENDQKAYGGSHDGSSIRAVLFSFWIDPRHTSRPSRLPSRSMFYPRRLCAAHEHYQHCRISSHHTSASIFWENYFGRGQTRHLRSSRSKQLSPPSVGHEAGTQRKDACEYLYQDKPVHWVFDGIQSKDGPDQEICRCQNGDDFGRPGDGRLVVPPDVECAIPRGLFL
jgi:hypothetical protein